MAFSVSSGFDELQEVVREVYGTPNDRWFDLGDMSINVSRFTMRAVKAVRRSQIDRIEWNLAVAFSWFASSANRLHMSLSDVIWRRFPYRCATCNECPCCCGAKGAAGGRRPPTFERPSSVSDTQRMFAAIYPPEERSLEHAAIHLVEELGEYQEAILMYRTRHGDADFRQIEIEAADYVSCALGLFTSIEHKYGGSNRAATALAKLFSHDCHECGSRPCVCTFDTVLNYNLNDRW